MSGDRGAHKLRHVVTLQQRTHVLNAANEPVPSWTDAATLRASVEPTGGAEAWRGMRVETSTTHVVTLRFWADVTEEKRFRWGARTLQIDSVQDVDGRGQWLVCQCREEGR